MEATNESLKQCPECLELVEELVGFDGEEGNTVPAMMCPECAEHFRNEQDWNDLLAEEGLDS